MDSWVIDQNTILYNWTARPTRFLTAFLSFLDNLLQYNLSSPLTDTKDFHKAQNGFFCKSLTTFSHPQGEIL